MNAGKTRKIHEPGAGSAPTDPEKRITLDAAPPRCNAPRCRNLASACSDGQCWTCAARRYERERQRQPLALYVVGSAWAQSYTRTQHNQDLLEHRMAVYTSALRRLATAASHCGHAPISPA